jgi:hypothetical protein
MPVIYNSKMIVPGPLLDIRREITRNEAGRVTRQFYTIQAKGKLLAWKGSPNSTGAFWTSSYYPGPPDENVSADSRLAALRTKMGALNDLFCPQGQWFEVQPFDGTPSIKFQPRIRNISFASGHWYDTVEYTIDMEADTVFFGTQEACGLLGNIIPDETWSIEATDQIGRTYRLTHNISSQQKNLFDANGNVPPGNAGWERAQSVVLPYLGLKDITKAYAPGVLNLSGWGIFNYMRTQQVDEGSGRFAVTETWLVYDSTQGTGIVLPPALDDFTVNSRVMEDGSIHVTLEGTITGMEVRDLITSKLVQTRWESAVLYFNTQVYSNLLNRAANYSGVLLNPVQLMSSIGRNPIQGTITYNAEYSNRRLPYIPNAIHEEISLQRSGGTDVFSSVVVLGRPWGPILQGINTISEKSIAISINATMAASTMLNPMQFEPNTDGLVLSLAPVATQVFRQKDDKSWSEQSGKYTRNVVFVYQ